MKTMLFNPFNGLPRHPSDIASDPEGILMLDPDEPVKAAPTAVEPDERAEPLSETEIVMATDELDVKSDGFVLRIARAIEAAHGIIASKGTPL